MEKLFFILFLFCFAAGGLNGQENRQERNARVEAMRVAYITEKLELTVEEAQMFWPIFNEYEVERKKIKKSFGRNKYIETMTSEEAEAFISQSFVRDQEMLDLRRTYFEKMKKAIPTKKIAKLSQAEKKFRQELLKRMRQRQEERGRRD